LHNTSDHILCSTTVSAKIINIIIKRQVSGAGGFTQISDTASVSSVIVGQKVELKVEVKPDNTTFTNKWTITGCTPIKDYQPTAAKAEVKALTDTEYSAKTITLYYTDGGNTTVKATVTVKEKDKDKSASFEVKKPEIAIVGQDSKTAFRVVTSPKVHTISKNDFKYMTAFWYSNTLPDGNPLDMYSALFLAAIKDPNNVQGKLTFCQLVKTERKCWYMDLPSQHKPDLDKNASRSTNGEYYLDGSFPYDSGGAAYRDANKVTLEEPLRSNDNPSQVIEYLLLNTATQVREMRYYYEVTVKDDFCIYLMYQPASYPNGIWVTIGTLKWKWGGVAKKGILSDTYIDKSPVLGTSSSELQKWQNNMPKR
jgi:hypothetical protein